MLQGMERGKVLDFWVWAVFFQKLLMSPSLHGAITPLYFHCLLSVKSLLSLLSAFRVFTLCCGSRVTETSL